MDPNVVNYSNLLRQVRRIHQGCTLADPDDRSRLGSAGVRHKNLMKRLLMLLGGRKTWILLF